MVEVDSSEEGRAILERVRIAISNATYEVVDVRRIRPMKGQPRTYFNKERLLKLAGSIKTVGQITPGYLREVEPDAEGRDRELVDGERRWQSILMAGIPTFRAMLVRIDDAAAQYIVSVIANFNREGHTVLEIAESIKVMHEDLKLGMQEIGDSIGFHPVYTANLYGLRRLTKTVRDMLDPEIQRDHNRQLPVTAAIEISRLPAERQEPLAWRILNRELNLRGLRKEVAQILEESGTPIQRRTQDPSNQRKTLEKKITGLRREAKDLRSRLEETPVSVLKGFGGMVADHCSTLESTKIDIDASLAVFGQVSQRT